MAEGDILGRPVAVFGPGFHLGQMPIGSTHSRWTASEKSTMTGSSEPFDQVVQEVYLGSGQAHREEHGYPFGRAHDRLGAQRAQ